MRIQVIRVLIIAAFLLVGLNLFYLQVIRGAYFHRLSQNNSLRIVPVEGERGKILARDGKVLAESSRAYHAAIIPQDMGKDRSVFNFLAGVVNEPASVLEQRYRKNRLTPFAPVSVAEGISRSEAIVIEESAYRFPGLVVIERYSRHYPSGEAGAHVVGYVGRADPARMREVAEYGYSADEPVGYSGVEEHFDKELRGVPGGREIEVNSRGQKVRLLSVRDSSRGADVTLTIDLGMQKAARGALGGARGAVVILDPDTGEVLAMASSPAFDPNAFVDRNDRSRVADYLQSTASPLMNRAIAGAFPPGSVFKIPVAAAGLEERKITPATTYDCPGTFTLGSHVFRSPHAWGVQDLTQAMGHSANEYFFHVGLLVGPEVMAKYARMLGLGQRTGVDLPYETRGRIPSRSGLRWFKGDTVNMSIGQGDVLATPIQIARMMAVFVNGGYLVTPHVVKSIGGEDFCSRTAKSGILAPQGVDPNGCYPKAHLSLRKDVWSALKKALYAPVRMESGTAHALDLPGLDTLGKTGTAQAGPGKMDHAWFAGVTSSSKRRIAYCLMFENGGSSANAVNAMREILVRLQENGLI